MSVLKNVFVSVCLADGVVGFLTVRASTSVQILRSAEK